MIGGMIGQDFLDAYTSIQVVALRNDRDPLLGTNGIGDHVEASKRDLPAGRQHAGCKHTNHRGFPRSVWSKQSGNLAATHLEYKTNHHVVLRTPLSFYELFAG